MPLELVRLCRGRAARMGGRPAIRVSNGRLHLNKAAAEALDAKHVEVWLDRETGVLELKAAAAADDRHTRAVTPFKGGGAIVSLWSLSRELWGKGAEFTFDDVTAKRGALAFNVRKGHAA